MPAKKSMPKSMPKGMPPKGMHRMPNGSMMKNSDMPHAPKKRGK